jgi:hypothetical protein
MLKTVAVKRAVFYGRVVGEMSLNEQEAKESQGKQSREM